MLSVFEELLQKQKEKPICLDKDLLSEIKIRPFYGKKWKEGDVCFIGVFTNKNRKKFEDEDIMLGLKMFPEREIKNIKKDYIFSGKFSGKIPIFLRKKYR